MPNVKSFKELSVYRLSREMAKDIFSVSMAFPKEEKYSLTDQIRRSSRSVGAQIAEAWGKRRYEKHFVMKLTDADAEQLETQHWLEIAKDCLYISHDISEKWIEQYVKIGKMLNSMISKAPLFCHSKNNSQ